LIGNTNTCPINIDDDDDAKMNEKPPQKAKTKVPPPMQTPPKPTSATTPHSAPPKLSQKNTTENMLSSLDTGRVLINDVMVEYRGLKIVEKGFHVTLQEPDMVTPVNGSKPGPSMRTFTFETSSMADMFFCKSETVLCVRF
jgi:hypothetical protein